MAATPHSWRAALYLAVSVPLGALWLVLLTAGLLVGGATAVAGVGVAILLGVLAGARAAADLERHLINALLDAGIAAPATHASADRWAEAVRLLATDPRTWRSLAWLVLRGLVGVLVLAGTVLAAVACVALLVVPFVDDYLQWGDWQSSAGWGSAWTVPLALAGLAAWAWVLRQVAAAHVRVARLLLGPDAAAQAAASAREAGRLSERAALARDLHDSIGHAVTVIVLQAEGARRLVTVDPPAALACLSTIGETGRRAMAELDHVLAVLAQEAVPARAEPTLADLPDLVRRAESAGMSIRVELPGLDRAAGHPASGIGYRAAQEALTNALRHAPGAGVQVRVEVRDPDLIVEVRNGPATRPVEGPGEPGRGLPGLGERVRLAGGRLAAGPEPGGGWLTRVELPGQ